jgi:Kef-type K+ transport system membrane component KefB
LHHLSESQILHFLMRITLLLLVSRGLGDLMKRIGQAAIIGELLAGVVLGPSVLGTLMPSVYTRLFAGATAGELVEAVGWIGAVLLLVFIGVETDLEILRAQGRVAAFVSILGMAVPFVSGVGIGLLMPASYLAEPGGRLIFTLFMAVAMSVSAVPVIGKILIELNLMQREIGLVILGAGLIDDSVGWLMLSLIAGLATSGTLKPLAVAVLVAETAAFIAACYFVGARLVAWLLRWIDDRSIAEHSRFTAVLLVALTCAVLTQKIGLHAVFGGFVAGLMLSRSPRLRQGERDQLEAVTMGFLAPLFFAYSGMQIDLSALRTPAVPMMILGVACLGKLVGCGAGGLFGGLSFNESIAVALGMNARGGMGIIVAVLGLSLGVLTSFMYTTLMLVAIVTSLITPPLLRWSMGGVEERPADTERAERQRLESQIPFRTAGTKLLVLVGGGPNAALATHLSAILASAADSSVMIFRAVIRKTMGRADEGDDSGAAEEQQLAAYMTELKNVAQRSGAANLYDRVATGETIVSTVLQETARGYDAIFAGASQVRPADALGGAVLRDLMVAARTPVVLTRGAAPEKSFQRVLAPISGAPYGRLGATLAMLYAQRVGASLTTLYVRPRSLFQRPFLYGLEVASDGNEVLAEITALADGLGVGVETQLASAFSVDAAILRALVDGNYDLLVMGAMIRSAGNRVYFGETIERVLRRARCAVAVVAAPESRATE